MLTEEVGGAYWGREIGVGPFRNPVGPVPNLGVWPFPWGTAPVTHIAPGCVGIE